MTVDERQIMEGPSEDLSDLLSEVRHADVLANDPCTREFLQAHAWHHPIRPERPPRSSSAVVRTPGMALSTRKSIKLPTVRSSS